MGAVLVTVLMLITFGGSVLFERTPAEAKDSYPEKTSDDPFQPPWMMQPEPEEEDAEPEEELVLQRFDLAHITAQEVEELVGQIGIEVNLLLLHARPHLFWAYGTEKSMEDLDELISELDRPDSRLSLQYEMIQTENVSSDRMVELLEDAGITFERYILFGDSIFVFDEEVLARWDAVEELVRRLDGPAGRETVVFVYRLNYLAAQDAAALLEDMGVQGIRTETYTENYSRYSREIIVITPPEKQSEVRSVLRTIDRAQSRIKVPLTSAASRSQLRAKRELLNDLSGVPTGRMHISEDIGDEDNPQYVLWAEVTPQRAEMLRELLEEL